MSKREICTAGNLILVVQPTGYSLYRGALNQATSTNRNKVLDSFLLGHDWSSGNKMQFFEVKVWSHLQGWKCRSELDVSTKHRHPVTHTGSVIIPEKLNLHLYHCSSLKTCRNKAYRSEAKLRFLLQTQTENVL